jgi:hypothetical protein
MARTRTEEVQQSQMQVAASVGRQKTFRLTTQSTAYVTSRVTLVRMMTMDNLQDADQPPQRSLEDASTNASGVSLVCG